MTKQGFDSTSAETSSLQPSLQSLVDGLWRKMGLRVDVGRADQVAGANTELERYLVIPSLARPRFLVPAGSRRASVASMLAYNRLRPVRTRMARQAIGMVLRVAPQAVWSSSTVVVRAPDDGRPPVSSLVQHLAAALGVPDLVAGIGLHDPDPNRKPTLQLFDRRGTAVGYAKIGWTPPTSQLVRNEASNLRSAGSGVRVHRPGLLLETTWNGMPVTVVAPLPSHVRRWSQRSLPDAAATLEVAAPARPAPIAASAWWAGLDETVREVRSVPGLELLAGALARGLETIAELAGKDQFLLGRWHGDWVPWNLALDRQNTYAFDWEHSAPDVPVGFDPAHWIFQVSLILDDASAAHAAAAVQNSIGELTRLGLSYRQAAIVAFAYLVEMTARTYRLQRSSGGWNPKLYPAMITVLDEATVRLRQQL